MTAKTAYHHGDLRTALLDAGDAVLAEHGLRGFTLRECARRAGVSHAAPKHHFHDVRGFLTAIAARGFERLTDMLQQDISRAKSLEAEFQATCSAYVAFAESYPEHFRIMFRSDLLDTGSADLRSASNGTFTELTNVILRQRGEPEINNIEDDAKAPFEQVVDDIAIGWCHIHGFAHLSLEGQLSMVDAERKSKLLATASRRLSQLLQGH